MVNLLYLTAVVVNGRFGINENWSWLMLQLGLACTTTRNYLCNLYFSDALNDYSYFFYKGYFRRELDLY